MSDAPPLAEPVIAAEFWANRSGHSIRIQLRESLDGRPMIDLWRHAPDGAGRLASTAKGFSLPITKLPALAKAVNKAVRKATELGLLNGAIPDDD
jgi:hypothetical protein